MDHRVFLNYLKEALTPQPKPNEVVQQVNISYVQDLQGPSPHVQGRSFKGVPRMPKSYVDEIDLIAFCLMPNHFHLLIKQKSKESMESFMRSLLTRYSGYFNKKNNRVGPLFQGRYKAAAVTDDRYLLHLSRYIHLNPSESTNNLTDAYSSYAVYLNKVNVDWVKPDILLKLFNNPTIPEIEKVQTYKNFVENYKKDSVEVLGKLILDDD